MSFASVTDRIVGCGSIFAAAVGTPRPSDVPEDRASKTRGITAQTDARASRAGHNLQQQLRWPAICFGNS